MAQTFKELEHLVKLYPEHAAEYIPMHIIARTLFLSLKKKADRDLRFKIHDKFLSGD